jgi:hypothetical protein
MCEYSYRIELEKDEVVVPTRFVVLGRRLHYEIVFKMKLRNSIYSYSLIPRYAHLPLAVNKGMNPVSFLLALDLTLLR